MVNAKARQLQVATTFAFGFFPTESQIGVVKHSTHSLEKVQICYDVLSYLAEYPDARDTLEGIVQWWLLDRKIRSQTSAVKVILGELIKKGLVVKSKGSDSKYYYQINRDKYEEILALLNQLETKQANKDGQAIQILNEINP